MLSRWRERAHARVVLCVGADRGCRGRWRARARCGKSSVWIRNNTIFDVTVPSPESESTFQNSNSDFQKILLATNRILKYESSPIKPNPHHLHAPPVESSRDRPPHHHPPLQLRRRRRTAPRENVEPRRRAPGRGEHHVSESCQSRHRFLFSHPTWTDNTILPCLRVRRRRCRSPGVAARQSHLHSYRHLHRHHHCRGRHRQHRCRGMRRAGRRRFFFFILGRLPIPVSFRSLRSLTLAELASSALPLAWRQRSFWERVNLSTRGSRSSRPQS